MAVASCGTDDSSVPNWGSLRQGLSQILVEFVILDSISDCASSAYVALQYVLSICGVLVQHSMLRSPHRNLLSWHVAIYDTACDCCAGHNTCVAGSNSLAILGHLFYTWKCY